MTPAIKTAKRAGIHFQIHSYPHDSNAASYGEEAANALQLDPRRVFKTLLVALDGTPGNLAVALVPVSGELDLKALAPLLRSKRVSMADAEAAQRATGYVLGGISPLGHKKRLPMVIDDSAREQPSIFVSAGRRGLEIELSAADLARLTRAQFAAIARSRRP